MEVSFFFNLCQLQRHDAILPHFFDSDLPPCDTLAIVDLYSRIPASVEKPASDSFFDQRYYKNQEHTSHPGAGRPDKQRYRGKQACRDQTPPVFTEH